MVLGGFKFEVGRTGFDELSENFAYKWNYIDNAKSVANGQFSARQRQTINLKGLISTREAGVTSFDELLEKAGKGEALTLVDGRGQVHGKFVVESLKKTSTAFIGQGIPRVVTFDMSIKEYEI